MKDNKDVVKEFNEIVNMTASELEKWLKSDDSQSAGWPKENEDGESVGHDSGRKIVEILKDNPKKEESKYTEDQISHMRKVVAYCKRHLAQEEKSNNEKSAEEVKKTKSYASLKNWGHDPLKARGEGGDDNDDEGEEQAGDKRKKGSQAQGGANKKRETRSAQKKQNGDDDDEEEEEDEAEDDGDEEEEEEEEDDKENEQKAKKSNGAKNNGQSKAKKDENKEDGNQEEEDDDGDDGDDGGDDSGAKPKKGPKKGDTVSWKWGSGNPQGKVLDVKGEKTTIKTKRGNEVSRDGDPEDPAVVLDTGKSKAIKSNHELN